MKTALSILLLGTLFAAAFSGDQKLSTAPINPDGSLQGPYNPPEDPYIPLETPDVPLEPPYIPLETPYIPLETPDVPLEPPYIPLEPPYIPLETPDVPLEPPYIPLEPPYIPLEPPYIPLEPPYIPLEPPYIPLEPPYIPEEEPYDTPENSYNPPGKTACGFNEESTRRNPCDQICNQKATSCTENSDGCDHCQCKSGFYRLSPDIYICIPKDWCRYFTKPYCTPSEEK